MCSIILTLLGCPNVIENPIIIFIRYVYNGDYADPILYVSYVHTWELWRRIFSGESSANDFLPFVATADKHDVCAHASIIWRKCFFVYERRERENTHWTDVAAGSEREKGGGNAGRRDPPPHIPTATHKTATVEVVTCFFVESTSTRENRP